MTFLKTLPYGYLFGLVPALMIGAIDDILAHIRRIGWVPRMLIIGALLIRCHRTALWLARCGQRRRAVHPLRTGGLVPGVLSLWLSHKYARTVGGEA